MIISAQKLLQDKEYSTLNDLIYQTYELTNWITEDYPNHFKHFYTKYVPGIFDGTREILGYYEGVKCLGICILKHEEEKKVCTLFICEEARSKHLATKLLTEAFTYLGTTQPLITIAEHKLDMFAGLIRKYDWKLTQILESYYGKGNELVFNGTIT